MTIHMKASEAERLGYQVKRMGNSAAVGSPPRHWHAVIAGLAGQPQARAVCGKKPTNAWDTIAGDEVTCPRCLTSLRRVPGQGGPRKRL